MFCYNELIIPKGCIILGKFYHEDMDNKVHPILYVECFMLYALSRITFRRIVIIENILKRMQKRIKAAEAKLIDK